MAPENHQGHALWAVVTCHERASDLQRGVRPCGGLDLVADVGERMRRRHERGQHQPEAGDGRDAAPHLELLADDHLFLCQQRLVGTT